MSNETTEGDYTPLNYRWGFLFLVAALAVSPGQAREMTTGGPEYYFSAGQLLGYGAKCGFTEVRREAALARIIEAIERESASAGSDATVQMKTRVYQGQADAALHRTAMTCDQVQTLWRGRGW